MTTGIRGRRWLPGKMVLGSLVVVLAVLAGAGWMAKPVWQPWWFASTLCGGHLSGGELADLLPDERLQAGTDTFGSEQHRSLRCEIDESDGRHFALQIEAELDTGESAGPLQMEFSIPVNPRYAYPASVPGFYGKFGPVIIQTCPKLGRDSEGRARRLVTRVFAHGVERDPSPASLRTAVRIANGAGAELGCGADPLPLPNRVETTHKLALGQTEGTMCTWLSQATLPTSPSGKEWQVVAPTDEKAPITSCSLLDSGTGETVDFTAWYGDWTDKPFERLLQDNIRIPDDSRGDEALLGENLGRAKARCAGESANFLASSYARRDSRPVLPMSEVRPLLEAFTADQAKRRGCTDLALPGHTVYPSRH
ncbi:hypothetical protein [Streptomyces laurentii]|uniref:hypothetical protein n=1 Tax=Streptomyces laurentii TaxID=39478 RepID=UPI00367AB559